MKDVNPKLLREQLEECDDFDRSIHLQREKLLSISFRLSEHSNNRRSPRGKELQNGLKVTRRSLPSTGGESLREVMGGGGEQGQSTNFWEESRSRISVGARLCQENHNLDKVLGDRVAVYQVCCNLSEEK